MLSPLFVILLKMCVAYGTVQIVSNEGLCKSSGAIMSSLSGKAIDSLAEFCPIISSISCGDVGKNLIQNSLLDTSFDTNNKGLCLQLSLNGASIYSSYDSMISSEFCGAKAVDFSVLASNIVCVSLPLEGLEDSLIGYDQVFRRIVYKANLLKKKLSVKVVIDSTGLPRVENRNEIIDSITQKIKEIQDEVSNEFSSESSSLVDVNFYIVNSDDEESILAAKSLLVESINNIDKNEVQSITAFLNQVPKLWEEVSINPAKLILTPAQKKSLFQVESAYAAGLQIADSTMKHWRNRVNQGKIVAKFGDRAKQLLVGVKKSFYERTAGTLVVRERYQREQELKLSISASITTLFRQQLLLLENEAGNHFKQSLVKLMQLYPEGSSELVEEQEQAMRNTLLRFKASVGDLDVKGIDGIDLEYSTELADLSATLKTQLKEFPESITARLEAMRKIDKQVKKPRKRKGKRAVNIALNLVGMLRPPGFGNLQGFIGYGALSLLGLPLELLLGIQNDGDAPEIIGDDREHPILRLQPKVHFDVDL